MDRKSVYTPGKKALLLAVLLELLGFCVLLLNFRIGLACMLFGACIDAALFVGLQTRKREKRI